MDRQARRRWLTRGIGVVVLLCAWGPVSLEAQDRSVESQPPVIRVPHVSRPPSLSDFLNGVPREAEAVVTDFRQYRPGDGEPVSQPTTAYLSYDDENLYVAFVCKDDPKLIRARLTKHDLIVSDDRTIVTLDTFNDRRRHYWFNVNPYGVQEDGISVSGEGAYSNWDTLWHSDAKITEDGYVTIHVIPFKSIRFPSTPQQTWGLVVGRFITRNNEWSTWPRVSSRLPSYDGQAAYLEGLENISPGRNIQLIPYGLFSRARYLDASPGGPAVFQTENDGRAGLDAKVVLKDALTLDVAVNPDFSQVESDAPQVTTNQRYEVVFPEKRPFFLENANYFATPEQLFFSRRIVDPLFGARLTGRIGNWTIGALAPTTAPLVRRVAVQRPLARAAHAGGRVPCAARVPARNARNFSVAAMATSQDFVSSYNRVYSLDTRLQLLANWYFRGQAMTERYAPGERTAAGRTGLLRRMEPLRQALRFHDAVHRPQPRLPVPARLLQPRGHPHGQPHDRLQLASGGSRRPELRAGADGIDQLRPSGSIARLEHPAGIQRRPDPFDIPSAPGTRMPSSYTPAGSSGVTPAGSRSRPSGGDGSRPPRRSAAGPASTTGPVATSPRFWAGRNRARWDSPFASARACGSRKPTSTAACGHPPTPGWPARNRARWSSTITSCA